jgi:hypothetical protein
MAEALRVDLAALLGGNPVLNQRPGGAADERAPGITVDRFGHQRA